MDKIEYIAKAIERYAEQIKSYRIELKQLHNLKINIHKKDNAELLTGNQTVSDREMIDVMLCDVDHKIKTFDKIIQRTKRWILDAYAEYLIEHGLTARLGE